MNVELYNEVNTMIKYKADRDHMHGWSWGLLIFLFLGFCGLAEEKSDLEARVVYLEQQLQAR